VYLRANDDRANYENMRARCKRIERQRNAAYASLREMIDLNETTGDPDPEITERARAILPENDPVDTTAEKRA